MLLLFMLKKGSAYRIHFWYMSKDDVISVMSNSNLIDKKAFYNFFTIYKRWVRKLIIKETRDMILNRAKDYYQNDKERLREQARDKMQKLI